MSTWQERLEKSAHEWVTECPKYPGYWEHHATFRAGWNACREDAKGLVEALERWKAATARNRKNSDVKNYEEFALECERAWDSVEHALAQWRGEK